MNGTYQAAKTGIWRCSTRIRRTEPKPVRRRSLTNGARNKDEIKHLCAKFSNLYSILPMHLRFGSSFMCLPGEMVDRSNTNDYTAFSTIWNTYRKMPRAPMWNHQQKGKPKSIASNKDEKKTRVNTSCINPTRRLPLVDVLYLVLTGMPDVLPYATRVFVVVFMCGVFPALIKLPVDSSPILCQRL